MKATNTTTPSQLALEMFPSHAAEPRYARPGDAARTLRTVARSRCALPRADAALSAPSIPIKVLRLPDVCKVTGLRRAMIYRLQSQQRFPHSISITDHAVGWIEREVQAWLEQRLAARREPGMATETRAAKQ